jgi:hypothetical protein
MKRQRGRNRKPGGGSSGGGGGGSPNNPNRAFESNGPEGMKIRGNAQHVYERYQQLARDAFTSGDRVLAENYLQHAEHYFRVLRTIQPGRPVSEIAARDAFASGFDIDFEDENGIAIEYDADGNETQGGGEQPDARENGEQRRDDRDRNEYRRDRDYRGENRDRPEQRPEQRNDQQRNDRGDYRRDEQPRESRDSQPRESRGEGRPPREPRTDREFREPRGEGFAPESRSAEPRAEGDQGPRRESRRDRFERRRGRDEQLAGGDPLAVIEPRGDVTPAPRAESAPVLRAEDGGESHMPAFLRQTATMPATAPAASAEAPEKPKRAPRRKKTESFEDTPEQA